MGNGGPNPGGPRPARPNLALLRRANWLGGHQSRLVRTTCARSASQPVNNGRPSLARSLLTRSIDWGASEAELGAPLALSGLVGPLL